MRSRSADEVSERAAATLSWMRTMDPSAVEREELLASGIAPHTTWTLYPGGFNAVVPELVKHLRTYGVRGVRDREADLKEQIRALRDVRVEMTSQLGAVHEADALRQMPRGAVPTSLIYELRSQFEQAQIGDSDSATPMFTASALWYCWWFMHHRAELPTDSQEKVDIAVSWFADHLLQLP